MCNDLRLAHEAKGCEHTLTMQGLVVMGGGIKPACGSNGKVAANTGSQEVLQKS